MQNSRGRRRSFSWRVRSLRAAAGAEGARCRARHNRAEEFARVAASQSALPAMVAKPRRRGEGGGGGAAAAAEETAANRGVGRANVGVARMHLGEHLLRAGGGSEWGRGEALGVGMRGSGALRGRDRDAPRTGSCFEACTSASGRRRCRWAVRARARGISHVRSGSSWPAPVTGTTRARRAVIPSAHLPPPRAARRGYPLEPRTP